MDYQNRPTQTQSAASSHSSAATAAGGKKGKGKNRFSDWGVPILVTAMIILLIAIVGVLAFGNSNSVNNEGKYVDTSKLQAVFLNTGQVYFGNIKALNNKYFVLTNIYYLQTSNSNSSSTTSSSNNVTLVKLGCEIHEPFDQMVINADQVTFWENLQSGGQVASAVSTFQKQNPGGQKCSDQSSSSSSTTNNVQNATNGNTSTKP